MFVIIGIVVVIGAILGGYLMEHGNLKVLIQPAELVIIGGAAMGTVLIANPLYILKQIIGGLLGVFGSSKYQQIAVPGKSQDVVRTFFSRAQGRSDGAGNRQRRSGAEPDVFQSTRNS